MDIGKEIAPIKVKAANTVASFLLFALSATGCNFSIQRGSIDSQDHDVLKYSTRVDPELEKRYREIIEESVGRECQLPEVEFRSITRPKVFLPRFRTEGRMIPPLSEGDPVSIVIPTLSQRDPVVAQGAKETGVTKEEHKKAQEKVTIIHEGIHLCSPFETDTKTPNSAIVNYTSPDTKRDHKGVYKLNYQVRRLEGATFTGFRLMVEESKIYSEGTIETVQFYQEEGDTEELITHFLTPERVLKKYGADSLEYKLSQDQIYSIGRVALANIFAARGAGFEGIIGVKQKNDTKAIFEMIKQGFGEIGKRAGIERKVTDESYSNFVLFSFLTKLSTEKAAKDEINPKSLINYFSNYFFGKNFDKTTPGEREQIVAVYNQIFINNRAFSQ